MRKYLLFLVALVFLAGITCQKENDENDDSDLTVDVTFTGAGTVDNAHKIYIDVYYNTPALSDPPGTPSDGQKTLIDNSGTISFLNVEFPAVVIVFFDSDGSGGFNGGEPNQGKVVAESGVADMTFGGL
jgi:hypothetical protein